MRTIRWLLIGLLVVIGAGCARADWIEGTLVTVDVTGVWTGSAAGTNAPAGIELSLQQAGPNVTGTLTMKGTQNSPPVVGTAIQGTINGDVLRFDGVSFYRSFQLVVDGDRMSGSYFQRSDRMLLELARKR
jgi:hypothetical protein